MLLVIWTSPGQATVLDIFIFYELRMWFRLCNIFGSSEDLQVNISPSLSHKISCDLHLFFPPVLCYFE